LYKQLNSFFWKRLKFLFGRGLFYTCTKRLISLSLVQSDEVLHIDKRSCLPLFLIEFLSFKFWNWDWSPTNFCQKYIFRFHWLTNQIKFVYAQVNISIFFLRNWLFAWMIGHQYSHPVFDMQHDWNHSLAWRKERLQLISNNIKVEVINII